MKKVIVLLSGGMDSVTALYDSMQKLEVVACASFNYGSKHNTKEIPYAKYHCDKHSIPHRIIKLDFVNELFRSDLLKSGGEIPEGHYAADNMKQTVVPFRNGIMLSVVAGLAESSDASGIVIAAHAGDHTIYPDCREEFMGAMAKAIQLGTYANIELIRPFIELDKSAIVRRGSELEVDYSQTWSCYKGQELHCGNCGTCVERREAFIDGGVSDPTVYLNTDPLPIAPAD